MLAECLLAVVLWTAKQWDAWLLVGLAGADSAVVVAAGAPGNGSKLAPACSYFKLSLVRLGTLLLNTLSSGLRHTKLINRHFLAS